MARPAAAAAFALTLLFPYPAQSDPVTTSTLGWAVNGIVSEIARAGDVAFVGGSFATLAPTANRVSNFAAFAIDSAVPVLPRLVLDGRVHTMVTLPAGGWLIGGEFTTVNGVSRPYLARLLADGTLDATFSVPLDGTVWSMTLSGSTLYIGGEFVQAGGATHTGIAALSPTTGAVDASFTAYVEGGVVFTIAASGASIYIGGDFTDVNGEPQSNVAAVLATTGAFVPAFDPVVDGPVNRVLLNGTDLYIGGAFTAAGGATRRGIARLTAATGTAIPAFNAQADGDVFAMMLSGSTLYVGGSFGQMGGQFRANLAAVNSTTGAAIAWNPGADGVVWDLAMSGVNLVVAGDFLVIAGVERLALAMLDTTRTTNIAAAWNPSLGNGADLIHLDAAGHVFVGGSFSNFGAVRRDNIAAIDLLSGELLPWNPGTDGWVHALDVFGTTVYLGGDFTQAGGAARNYVAAVDAMTGALKPWSPAPDLPVRGLVATPAAVYFVGTFTQAGASARGYGAAASHTGTLLPWNPAADDTIETLFVDGSRVFVGGVFTTLGGQPRESLGAVNASSGAVSTSFHPGANGVVFRLEVQNDIVFIGGSFDMVAGATRNNAAAVQSSTTPSLDGQLTGWNPDPNGAVYDIDAFGSKVYLAGAFTEAGATPRPGIAMVDAGAGGLRPWTPVDVNGGAVSTIDVSDSAVLFAGLLNDTSGVGIGAVLYPEAGLPGTPRPPSTPDILVQGSALRIDWAPPALGSRPQAYIIEGGSGPGRSDLAAFSTGNPSTTFGTGGLPPGAYYVRLRSANASGASPASGEVSFNVGSNGCSGPSSPPFDVTATVNGTTVTISWKAPVQSIASVYRVQAGTASGGSGIGTFDIGGATSYTVAAPPGAYFVRVIAVNACGVSAPSSEAVVLVGSPVVPPLGPFALEAAVTGSTVALTWSPPSVGTGPFTYRVEAGSGTGLSNLATVISSQPSFTATNVPSGIYYVRVRANGAAGTGPASNELVLVVP